MKKSIAALALALTLVGTLASCSNRDPNANNNSGNAGNENGVTSGTAGSDVTGSGVSGSATAGVPGTSGTAGTVSRRYGGGNTYNSSHYFDDGRYTAGSNGHVYDNGTGSRDLTQDARDLVRDTGEAIGDVGRGLGNAVRDITGTNSRESDSSAARQ